jgi:hypothetical protein
MTTEAWRRDELLQKVITAGLFLLAATLLVVGVSVYS